MDLKKLWLPIAATFALFVWLLASSNLTFHEERRPSVIVSQNHVQHQHAAQMDSDHLNCGTDELIQRAPEDIIQRQDELERQYQAWVRSMRTPNQSSARPAEVQSIAPPPYEIPIVFHILHNNGPENISDARIQTSLDQLNASMANTGYYDQGTGVDTEIQFCMAQRTPDNLPTNGITRQVTPLTELEATAEDLALKDLARWNTNDYVNVYVVREICGLGLGCGVAGYAYYPGAHGGPRDGIVVEARWLGDDEAGNAVLTHEIGHYLGLRHTFDGGCTNNDCLADGDRVCDTPPDNSTAAVPCGGSANTCTTDTDSGFATDQPDMHINYMDYGFFSCYSALTAGQRDRMHFFIDGIRSSLLESYGCRTPCPELVVASLTGAPGGTLFVGDNINLTSTSTGTNTNSWFIDGVFQTTGTNFNFTFTAPGTYAVTLRATSSVPVLCNSDEVTIFVTVVCPYEADINASDQFPVEFISVNYSTTDNAPFYEWTVDGVVVSNAASFDYTYPGSGIYELCLRKGTDACEQTVCQTIFVTNVFQPCSGQTFVQYLEWEVGPDGGPATDYRSFRAILQDGGDLGLAGISPNAIHLAKVTAVGQPIWSKRIDIGNSSSSILSKMHFLIDDDGRYLVYCSSNGGLSGGNYLLVKYDPVADNVEFSEIYSTGGFPLHVDLLPNSNDYCLINTNRGTNAAISDYSLNILSVDRNNGQHALGLDLNRSWEVTDSAILAKDAQWHNDILYIASTVDTIDGTVVPANQASVQAFDENGDPIWSRRLRAENAFGLEKIDADQIWVDDDGILVGSNFTGGAGSAGGIAFSKLDLNGQVEWERTYTLPGTGESVVDIRAFQGGYLAMVQYDFTSVVNISMGLMYLDDFGNLVWSRSYGDEFDALSLNGQNLFTAGNTIFLVGGLSVHSAPGTGSFATILAKLNEFGLAEDECLSVPELPVEPLQTQADWEDYLVSELNIVPVLGGANVSLQDQSYLPNNTCNTPCFEICGNGIDDDFNGETDCEDAALAQTCCCLPGPEPPMLGDTILCPGEIWSITVPELEGGTFTWTPAFPDSTLRIDTVGDYSLTLTDSCGRDTTVSFFVDYLPPSTPPDLGPDTTVCANGLTELDAGPGWESYLWFDLSTEQIATAWGPGDFWVQVTDSCGQIYSDTMTVTVEAATELDLGPPDDTIACGIDSIDLSAPVGYQRYEWFPVGPLNCNNCPDVRVAVPPPGDSLTIFALAYTENGCAAGDSIRIWTSAGQGQNLSDVFCNGATYTFGDSTFTQSGQYFIPSDCASNDTLNLTELPPVPTLSETFDLCRGDSLFINGQWYVAPATAIDTFSSANGCDSVFVTNLDVFLTFETAEDFSLCANDSLLINGEWYQAPDSVIDTLSDLNGCDSLHTINLIPLDDAVMTAGTARICAGDSIFLQGEWQTEAGLYSDSLVSASGCDSIHQIMLAVDPIPEATWLVGPECDSEFLIVTIVPTVGQAPFDISWDQGPGQPPLIGPEQMVIPGTYRINIVDANGCAGVQDIPVPFFPPIEYDLESAFFDCPSPDLMDAGYLLISDISQLLEVSINGVVQSPLDSVGLPPADQYTVSITDIQGCVRDTIIVPDFGSGSGIDVSLPAVIRLDLGDSVRLSPQITGGTGPLNYTWLPSVDLSCDDCAMPWASPAETAEYVLSVSGSSGCTGEARTRIEIIANSDVYMPTAFSPNEDGVNDRLFPGVPPAVVQIQSFQIFDRWGGLLYMVEDVRAEDGPIWGWNGESNGRPATVGVYVWTLEVVLANGRTRSLAGDVTLIR